ncbi:MAG: cupredoxin domain-containing protein [Candidatus Thorarchaeota archaeon]
MKRIDVAALAILITFSFLMPAGLIAFHANLAPKNIIHARTVENGGWLPDVITIKAGQPTTLTFISDDVVHSFVIDSLNISLLIYPGHTSSITFTVKDPGTYDFHCGYFCSPKHFSMKGELIVES